MQSRARHYFCFHQFTTGTSTVKEWGTYMRRERRLKIHTILKNKINCHTLHTAHCTGTVSIRNVRNTNNSDEANI